MSKENKSPDKLGSSEENVHAPPSQPVGIPNEHINMVGASPPRFVTFDQLMSAADSLKNITLVHEIAVNDEFELIKEEPPPNSWKRDVTETVKRAFWDVFKKKISEDPPDLSFACGMLEEMREMLLEILLPHQQRLRDQINEVLDLALIKQQIENNAFDFDYYAKYTTDLMAKMCAPVRDEKIAEIRNISDVVSKFRVIMETLELMRRDMTNFTIKQIRPYIQQNAIEYERNKFSEYFEAQRAVGVNALQYTEVWLKRNYEKQLQRSVDPSASSGSATSSPRVLTPANVVTEAYLEVLDWKDPDNFPETMMMDMFRFMALRDKLHALCIITSVQLITFSAVGPSIEGTEGLKKQLKEHVDILLQDIGQKGIKPVLESVTDQVIKDVNDSLTSRSLPPLTNETKQILKGQIMDLSSMDMTVQKLMYSRLLGFIHEGMTGKNVSSLQVPKGCSAVQQELSQVLGSFLRLTSHNRSVFGQQYSEIIQRLMHHGAGPPPSTNSAENAA